MLLGQNTRNGLINARFAVAQRASSLALNTTSGYVVDRWTWRADADGGTLATGTISKQAVNNSHPFFIDQENFVRIQNTSQGSSFGTNSYAFFCQYIEGVQRFAGKRVTVSIWAESTIPNKVLNVNYAQGFGSGGSSIVVGGQQITLTGNATLTRYNVTLDIPSIAGKIIGFGSYLAIYFEFQAGLGRSALAGISQAVNWQANGNVDIYRIQTNEGAAADFELAGGGTIAAELALCQRYYWKTYDVNTAPGTAGAFEGAVGSIDVSVNSGGSNTMYFPLVFPVKMRTTPAVSVYNPSSGLINSIRNSSGVTNVTFSSIPVGTGQTGIVNLQMNTASSTISMGQACQMHFTADAEF